MSHVYFFLEFVFFVGCLACFNLSGINGTQDRSLSVNEVAPTAAGVAMVFKLI